MERQNGSAQKSAKADRESKQKARAAERDKVFQRVTTLKSKGTDYESAVTDAQTLEHRRLAQERLINYQWEVRVESLRLQVIEDQNALDIKLADTRELQTQACHAHLRLAERMLELMRARYREASDKEERDLNRAEADEKSKARWSGDPLERFRARRMAELLALQALVLKSEQALATSPSPSFEEQRNLADRADRDFARIKELLDDGRVSRLDAIRLNNDFRRIGPERERLLRNEMAAVEAQLQFFEDALTNVEIELLQDSLHDRFEQDLLRERVSPERWADGEKLLIELEHQQREILEAAAARHSNGSRNERLTLFSRSSAVWEYWTRNMGSSAHKSSGYATKSRSRSGLCGQEFANSTPWSKRCCNWPKNRQSPISGVSLPASSW